MAAKETRSKVQFLQFTEWDSKSRFPLEDLFKWSSFDRDNFKEKRETEKNEQKFETFLLIMLFVIFKVNKNLFQV